MLDFIWEPDYSAEAFVTSPSNAQAYSWLQAIEKWPKNQTLLLGPKYSGKTHLCHIWASHNSAKFFERYSTSFDKAPYVIDQLEEHDPLDLMRLIYHVDPFNLPVLWTCQNQEVIYKLKLNDLKTRLLSLVMVKIEEPDEDMFKSLIRKRCNDFGLHISNECVEYITRRNELTYKAIHEVTLKLHQECLMQQRAPSVSLLHDLFGEC